MRSPRFVAAALCSAMAALSGRAAQAQSADTTSGPATTADTTSGPVLTLEEATTLALRNNPDHLSVVNNRQTAAAKRRAAYGGLLPRLDAQLQGEFRQQGSTPINGVTFDVNSDIYQSNFWLGLTYKLNANTFLQPKIEAAGVRAAEADISGSAETVRAGVAQAYLTVLQDAAKADLQDTLVNQASVQLELAKAKAAVGSGTQLDINRAEVALGQAQVAALQARNQVEVDKLRLFQDMGVPQPPNVRLTTSFEVRAPTFSLDSVLDLARQKNPGLVALRSRDRVASLGVKSARSDYLPTLQLTTGWGGYTYEYSNPDVLVQGAQFQYQQGLAQCAVNDSIRTGAGLAPLGAGCTSRLQPVDAAQIRAANNQFPFNFTKQPFSIQAMLSLPIFDNFQREERVQEAEAQRNDARYNIRKQELALTADVTGAYLTLVTQAKTVDLQQRNAAKAREELALAEARYRVGAATFLDLSDARASFERAENDRINAVYEYHKAFAALESAVGRPLR
ncbi:MAG TPA: TolC family protein [Gemmatimonadaceae bacterium]|nr:TolC family protein [Gemmatimonadaceae bacterium]